MGKVIETINKILEENFDKSILYKRNLVKEYLQIFVLDYIYSHPTYKDLIFYGGSALFHCYDLPRLSEDLDFVDLKKKINSEEMAYELRDFLSKKIEVNIKIKIQKFRIYLKFPLSKRLGLAQEGESDWLFLKIEIFQEFDFCHRYKIEIKPIFKYNRSILIKTFDLSTLMSTKIRAVLYRKWEKTNKQGKVLVSVKGRDYFDLMWYLQKGIKPNLKCLEVKDKEELKRELLESIKKINKPSIRLDLENFIADRNFVKQLSRDIKSILENYLENW